jgi:DNA polymerase elongation subunit (family B)
MPEHKYKDHPNYKPPKKVVHKQYEEKEDVEDKWVEDSYEGATVLDPLCDIYVDDPVSVLDYASLYPSSMISENLSHDCLIKEEDYEKYKDVEYKDIEYVDKYKNKAKSNSKTMDVVKTARFVQVQ